MAEEENLEGLAKRAMDRGEPTGWFEDLYARAAKGEMDVPWAQLEPHRRLVEWIQSQGLEGAGKRALDVGCGYGDNAAALAACGFEVVGVDIAPSAVEHATARFGERGIEFRAVDVMSPPEDLRASFDLVVEIYTLQALPSEPRGRLAAGICSLVRPGGRLLVVCVGREAGEDPGANPPWPLARDEIEALQAHGMRVDTLERFASEEEGGWWHYVATLIKA